MFLKGRLFLTQLQRSGKIILVRSRSYASSHRVVIVGCYKGEKKEFQLTESGNALQDIVGNNFNELLSLSNFKAEVGQVRSFFNLHAEYPCITIAGLGDVEVQFDKNEGIDQKKENVRIGIGSAIKSLKNNDFNSALVDSCGAASAAGEGAILSNYVFDKYKSTKKGKMEIDLLRIGKDCDDKEWQKGQIAAESQNFARALMETPSNYKYPSLFVETICEKFSKYTNVNMVVRDEKWAEEKKMDCFLSVGQGSVNPSAIVELHYNGGNTKPIVLIGKGVTFDSGGISIKASKAMSMMRGDMGGAACMLATLDAVVKMELPINLIVLVALAENMPSGTATKPGDVFTAMNGKTVEVDDTDFEGRLVLADTLCYAGEFNPSFIMDAATLTGEVDAALGAAATGAFTTCNTLWSHLCEAGVSSGDRMWRMPLYNHYTKQMECSITADLRNSQKISGSAGACTAATFLKEFVNTKHWAHLDIAGVGGLLSHAGLPYLDDGMSGRPTRTLIETISRLAGEKRIYNL